MTTSHTQPAQSTDNPDTILTRKMSGFLTSGSTILEKFRAEPNRAFTRKDIQDCTGQKDDAVWKALGRLAKSGEITRLSRGFFKYNQTKEEGSLASSVRSGTWKFENILFVRKETRSTPMSGTEEHDPDTLPKPKPGYPKTLPTGQKISWEIYSNGTEMIRLSANGHPPFSPDAVLTNLYYLENEGFDSDSWKCTSCEYNQDHQEFRFNGDITHKIDKGLLLKLYQHDSNNARIEIADRRLVPAREVIELFGDISTRLYGHEALTLAMETKKQVKQVEKIARDAYKLGSNAFQKASEIKREKVGVFSQESTS